MVPCLLSWSTMFVVPCTIPHPIFVKGRITLPQEKILKVVSNYFVLGHTDKIISFEAFICIKLS